jgi:AraC-like DNA-binding protein/mannose-6-phosphate isomerase-like protein (cupin superfamily)
MVRNARLAEYESTPRPVVAIGNRFADGHIMPSHRHARGQLVFAETGVMTVGTEHGRWVVPPGRAVWIPSGIAHELRMMSAVDTITIWVETSPALGLPAACRVVQVSPLMRSLLQAAADVPSEYDPNGREGVLMSLLLHELRVLPELPLCLPFPQHERLAARCHAFLQQPESRDTIDRWCAELGMSRRAFTRAFRKETGLSFAAWRQQACLFAAMPRLAAGEAITTIALDLGYESPAAFTTMFKRLQGVPPRQYLSETEFETRRHPPR